MAKQISDDNNQLIDSGMRVTTRTKSVNFKAIIEAEGKLTWIHSKEKPCPECIRLVAQPAFAEAETWWPPKKVQNE